MAYSRAKIGRQLVGESSTLRGGATLWALDETTPAALAANRAFFGEPVLAPIASLFVQASSYAVGLRHVSFKLRNSIPQVGDVTDGWGEWYVFIGGSEVPARRAIGTLDYGGEFPDGAIVRYRYRDRAGNASDWQDYTVSVTGTYAATLYVSAAGNDANAGTEASPIATVEEAMSRMNATLTAGQVGAVYYRRDDVFTPSATVTLTGTSKLVRSMAYGVGAKPILRWNNMSGFGFTDATSLHFQDLELDGQQVFGSPADAIGCARTTPTQPVNLMVVGCVFRNWNSSIVLTGTNGEDGSNWTDGRGDFVLVADCQFYNAGTMHFYAGWSVRWMVWRDAFLGDTNGENNDNIWRVRKPRDAFLHRVTWDATNNASLRWEVGPSLGPTDKMARVSMLQCKLIGPENPSQHFLTKWGFGRTAPDGAGEGYLEDVRLVGCVASRGEFMFQGCSPLRVQLWGCQALGGGYRLWPANAVTAGTIRSIEFRDCAHVDDEDGTQTFWFQDSPSLYLAGSIAITGGVRWVRSGVSNRFWIIGQAMTVAEVASKLAACEGNQVGLQSSTSFEWVGGTDTFRDLTWWKANTSFDATSLVTSSVGTANYTNVGTTLALVDLRRTASSSYINDSGFARLAFDADGLARPATSPDAGPFEFGASPVDPPPGGGPTTLFADGLAFFAIFGDADASARVAADGAGFVSLIGEADASARIAADGAGFVALWGDAEVSETIGGVDPPGATGSGYVSIWGDADAAARIAGEGAGFVSLFGDAAAAARIAGDGVGFVSLFGDASALGVPASTGRGVQIVNDSADLFEGVVSINTDLPVPDAFGQRHGITFVRGLPSSLDTTRVDLIVSIPAGGTLTLPDLIAETTNAPPAPTVPANFFGGDPAIGGVPFTKISEEVDGLTVVTEWRLRSGVWIVYLITYNVPGEPWALLECLTLHSNPISSSLREFWPAWLITWGTGTVEFLGRSSDGSVVAAARGFGDGQCVLRPGLAWWPGRYRNAQDTANVAAMRTHRVMGHGIQRLYPDGTPPEAPGHATWAAGALAGAIARLDDWSVSPHNILPESGPTGGQADQGFVRCEPYYYPSALLAVYLEGCRWGAKPSYFAELNGDVLNLSARPGFRAFDGRPHPPTTQDEPGQPGSGMLGKPGELVPSVHSEGWGGFGQQHWWLNGLVAAARYTGRRGPQRLLEFNSNLYLASRFPPGFGSNTAIFSTRDLMLEGCNTTHFWVNLRNRTMATALRDRARVRANGPWLAWINPTHGFPPAYWQVYNSTPTASTPNLPAYIPWQQGPGAYWLDLCRRVLGGMEALTSGIVAGAYRVLDDVWTFEFSPTFGVNRWVEYEQQQLPPPYGAGIKGRDGNWTVDWFPPLIAFIRRIEPSNVKANAIWAQMLAQLGGGGQWIPPEPLAAPSAALYAEGLGFLSLWGDASASTAPPRQAEGVGWLGLWAEADAVSSSPPAGPPALRNGPLALRRLGGEIKSWPRWKWGR